MRISYWANPQPMSYLSYFAAGRAASSYSNLQNSISNGTRQTGSPYEELVSKRYTHYRQAPDLRGTTDVCVVVIDCLRRALW